MDRFDFFGIDSLVLYQVVDLLYPGRVCGKELVSDVDIALAFPQGKAGVGYVPCPGYKVVRRGGVGSCAIIDIRESDRDGRHLFLGVGWACEGVEGVEAFGGRSADRYPKEFIVNLYSPNYGVAWTLQWI